MDLVTTGDRRTDPSSVERRRKSNDVGQGDQPTAPVDIANNIVEKNYVLKTLSLLSPPQFGQFTNIVSAYDVDITRDDFERLQTRRKLNDKNIECMMRWWSGQVNGRSGSNPSPPQSNPHLRRCYFWCGFHGNTKFGTFLLTHRTGKRHGVNRHHNKATKKTWGSTVESSFSHSRCTSPPTVPSDSARPICLTSETGSRRR